MSIKYEVDYNDIKRLQEKFKNVPRNIENLITSILHNEGIARTTTAITERMPISNRTKKHAKYSKWSKSEKINLGFIIKARGGAANKKGSFGYLVFPNEGRGPHNPLEQRFMEEGLEKSTPDILDILNQHVDKYLEEEF
jgi:hypothetical protein